VTLASSGGAVAAEPGCAPILRWAHDRIESQDDYLERWRDFDPGKPENGPPWAIGYFTADATPAPSGGQGFLFHPEKLTLFGLVRQIYQISDQTPSEPAADEALDAITDASKARGWTLGPGETIQHNDALTMLTSDAMTLCEERGKAELPTIGFAS
jgi:hypothetical protein